MTWLLKYNQSLRPISTHTPCVGRDTPDPADYEKITISTHTPCVGRDEFTGAEKDIQIRFQLTRPAWGVTCDGKPVTDKPGVISTHTPCVGRDINTMNFLNKSDDFNSHALRGA